ncbi:hypothetical protein CTM46_02250 [Prevotella intermedia]|uniref:Uncharacterized protein n=1 Tax=Prevotella intermedia TaxID=28131 RepID=A0A2D3LID9_PREIN|nr:hypothetical protein CTM46_02250 [Prevotella intermedia]
MRKGAFLNLYDEDKLYDIIYYLLKNMLFTSVGVIIQKEDNIFVNGQKNMILMNQGQILSE